MSITEALQMQERDENERICEELLDWVREPITLDGTVVGFHWGERAQGGFQLTPKFNDWEGAGLILEALGKRNPPMLELQHHFVAAPPPKPAVHVWEAGMAVGAFITHASAPTAPRAVRQLALSYLRHLEQQAQDSRRGGAP